QPQKIATWGNNVYIKIPVNPCVENDETCNVSSDGIKAIKELTKSKIPINCTLIFTPEQALLASKAGAKFVSPFMGREDDYIRELARIKFKKEDYFPQKGFRKGNKILSDNGIISGVDLVKKCVEIFRKNNIKTEVLAASIRSTRQFRESAEVGADIATVPFKVIKALLSHHKTQEGMKNFIKDIVPEYKKVIYLD
ncbi:MAG: transaldolase family protein, partial [Candidatus Nanoarchaeia archaeon]